MSKPTKDAKQSAQGTKSNTPTPGNTTTRKSTPTTPEKKSANKTTTTEKPQPDYAALLSKLVAHANAGEQWAIARLRKFLDANPRLWKKAGDLSALAESSWLELIAGSDKLMDESVKRQLHAMKAELAGPHPTELERLLIQQVTTTWLAVTHAEMSAANPAGASLDQANFRLRKAESAQKRHLTAMKTLATLRTLSAKGLAPLNAIKVFKPHAGSG